MRGFDATQTQLFTSLSVEDRVPARHPIRALRTAAAEVLQDLRPQLDAAYAQGGREGLSPEQVLRAMVVWAMYSVPSERQLIEQIDYNLLFRWFIGLELGTPSWSRERFRQHRLRLQRRGLVGEFLARLFARSRGRLLANPHFLVNRSLIEEWLGQTTIEGL